METIQDLTDRCDCRDCLLLDLEARCAFDCDDDRCAGCQELDEANAQKEFDCNCALGIR